MPGRVNDDLETKRGALIEKLQGAVTKAKKEVKASTAQAEDKLRQLDMLTGMLEKKEKEIKGWQAEEFDNRKLAIDFGENSTIEKINSGNYKNDGAFHKAGIAQEKIRTEQDKKNREKVGDYLHRREQLEQKATRQQKKQEEKLRAQQNADQRDKVISQW